MPHHCITTPFMVMGVDLKAESTSGDLRVGGGVSASLKVVNHPP